MTSKNITSSRFGLGKAGLSKAESDAEKLRKENGWLKRSLEELSKGRSWERERNRLLEKILALETTKQKQIHELEQKDKQILSIKDQLSTSDVDDVTSLRNQLAEKSKDAKRREQLYKSLSEETEKLKNELSAITLKCKELENSVPTLQTSSQTASSHELGTVQTQLKDALEKNQQWLVYDQQREAYVKGLLARIFELEQETRKHCDISGANQFSEDKQDQNSQLLLSAQKDSELQREIAEGLKLELSDMRRRYEEKSLEVKAMGIKFQAEQSCNRWKADEDRKASAEKMQKLQMELETTKAQYEDETKRSADLLYQIRLLQKSSINQQEEQSRNRIMEQQMLNISSDFENEKLERQNLQHQLSKVLKELRKAREQIARLENTKAEDIRILEPVLNRDRGEEEEKLTFQKSKNHLDESFLECPKCKAQYPTSQHRNLLEHIDYCNY
ncbi:centrosomal protein of 55 kDa isoform X2 [Narcine bancroftii]|uniref:centrosomal protein of 55 kDa isoform X2 n=1 Tax=Narcine bancroftii TaxID=1343680 RepID=UPI00383128A6